MKLQLAIVLACTLLGLAGCVVEPYGRGGAVYYGGGRYDDGHHDDGHHDDGHRVWHE